MCFPNCCPKGSFVCFGFLIISARATSNIHFLEFLQREAIEGKCDLSLNDDVEEAIKLTLCVLLSHETLGAFLLQLDTALVAGIRVMGSPY